MSYHESHDAFFYAERQAWFKLHLPMHRLTSKARQDHWLMFCNGGEL